MRDSAPLDRRLFKYVQERIGDPIRQARDPNCQDLLKKMWGIKQATKSICMLSDSGFISRRVNYRLHVAVRSAEEVAYYMHYYFEPNWQRTKYRAIETAKTLKERALVRLRKEACG